MRKRISIPVRAVSLCHTAKGPAQGAFGLRWSPVPPSRAGTLNPKRGAFHTLYTFDEGMLFSATDQRSVMLISKGGVFRSILKGVKTG